MDAETTGRYRVRSIDGTVADLVDLDAALAAIDDPEEGGDDPFAPVAVDAGDVPTEERPLAAGAVIDATIEWDGEDADLRAFDPIREDRYYYGPSVTGLFEAAVEAWEGADGDGVVSRVTRGTDGEPNGACYVFAERPGPTSTYEALRSGVIPIEPLVARAESGLTDDGPRAVFVLDPEDRPFAVVYVVFDRDGVLARTMRDTYGVTCPSVP